MGKKKKNNNPFFYTLGEVIDSLDIGQIAIGFKPDNQSTPHSIIGYDIDNYLWVKHFDEVTAKGRFYFRRVNDDEGVRYIVKDVPDGFKIILEDPNDKTRATFLIYKNGIADFDMDEINKYKEESGEA